MYCFYYLPVLTFNPILNASCVFFCLPTKIWQHFIIALTTDTSAFSAALLLLALSFTTTKKRFTFKIIFFESNKCAAGQQRSK